MGRLVGKKAIVTGGARGVGREIAQAFAAEGADVAVVDVLDEREGGEVVGKIEGFGRRTLYRRADVADETEVRGMVEEILETFGCLDILVNNAGILSQVPLARMAVEEWDRVLAVNLRGTFLCSRFVLPHMLERGEGRIINISSQLGQLGAVGLCHYSASKGGIIAFTKALAREAAPLGVLVNAIAPGPIKTGIMPPGDEEEDSAREAALPIGRFGEVGEVAPTAVFLASDDASYYVGQTLGPNGGDVML